MRPHGYREHSALDGFGERRMKEYRTVESKLRDHLDADKHDRQNTDKHTRTSEM